MSRNRARICRLAAILLACCPGSAPTAAGKNAATDFDIPQSGVIFLTGDSWRQGNQVFRLYGVQACLRGAAYTDNAGQKQDCGAISAAMLAAFVRDTKPRCSPVVQVSTSTSQPSTVIVVCAAHVGSNVLDLGSMMITQGFDFAALDNARRPVYAAYLIQEALARQAHAGLWAFRDVTRPNLNPP